MNAPTPTHEVTIRNHKSKSWAIYAYNLETKAISSFQCVSTKKIAEARANKLAQLHNTTVTTVND